MEQRFWVSDKAATGEYSGEVYKQVSKRHNKDGTISLRVRHLYHLTLTTGVLLQPSGSTKMEWEWKS